ncbi:MAG: cation-transporting P-type ATPase [Dehalococcoidia bacterium]
MTPGSGDGLVPSPAEAVTLDRDQILDALGAQLAGLSSQEAERRLRRFGPNQLPAARTSHLFRLILGQISHILALMLWAAALLAFLAELPQLGWAIIAIVLINGAFSFWQEYRASELVQALHRRVPLGARVFRDGVAHRIQANAIVPGDTVAVQRGDRVPADARLLAATARLMAMVVLPVQHLAENAVMTGLACVTQDRRLTSPRRCVNMTAARANREREVVYRAASNSPAAIP